MSVTSMRRIFNNDHILQDDKKTKHHIFLKIWRLAWQIEIIIFFLSKCFQFKFLLTIRMKECSLSVQQSLMRKAYHQQNRCLLQFCKLGDHLWFHSTVALNQGFPNFFHKALFEEIKKRNDTLKQNLSKN